MTLLNIVTPVSREENLPRISESLRHPFAGLFLTWYLIFDYPPQRNVSSATIRALSLPPLSRIVVANFQCVSVRGDAQRNYALRVIEDGWVYFLDDDNLLHPRLIPEALPFMKDPSVGGLLFHQLTTDGQVKRLAKLNALVPGYIDTAQFMIRRDVIGDISWPIAHNSDGFFIDMVYTEHSARFRLLDKFLCYYNYLSPSDG